MIRRAQKAMLVLLFVAIGCGAASAQTWEMAGFVGFTPSVALDRRAPELTELNIRGGFTWGVQGARFFTPRWGAEVMWTRQTSALEVGTAAGRADLYGMTLGQLQANVVYQFGGAGARLRPFLFGGAGAAFFGADDLDSEVKAAFGFGGGVKYFPWARIGLRGHFRCKPTWLNDDPEGAFCDPFGFCQGWLQPIEVGASVIVRF